MALNLVLRTAVGRTTPLTNTELDSNFTKIDTDLELKLYITDYNYTSILSRLNGAPSAYRGYGSNLDVRYLQGIEPNSALPAATNKSSVVSRDANGDFSARTITAALAGKSTTSGTADEAIKLQTARTINDVSFNGTANITVYDKTKLPTNTYVAATSIVKDVTYVISVAGNTNWVALGSANNAVGTIFTATVNGSTNSGTGYANVVLTSRLQTKASTTGGSFFSIPPGSTPTTLYNGDLWATSAGLFNRVNGATRTFAYTDSNITGKSANVTGVVAIANGGTGKTTATDGRIALGAAKSGENSDITKITGLTTALATNQGGTGLSAPGAAKNLLISDGTKWTSAAPSGTWNISISGNAATSTYTTLLKAKNPYTTGNVSAGSFVVGRVYKIASSGNTVWTSIGAANNTVGTQFTATGVGSGTGIATEYQYIDNTTSAKNLTSGNYTTVSMHYRPASQSVGSYGTTLTMSGYDQYGASQMTMLYNATTPTLYLRNSVQDNTQADGVKWSDWATVVTDKNIYDYTVKKDGTGATGSWGINITGSASSAASATDSTKWNGARRFVQSSAPTGAVNGDVWFKI